MRPAVGGRRLWRAPVRCLASRPFVVRRLARRTGGSDSDDGRAMIEVIFLAVLILIPTVYILAAVMRIQAATFAVTQAARDAGRVMDSAPTVSEGVARAEEIAQIALTDQRVPAEGLDLRFVPAGSECSGGEIAPSVRGGDVYDILSLIHISEPTRRTPISYAVFCLK